MNWDLIKEKAPESYALASEGFKSGQSRMRNFIAISLMERGMLEAARVVVNTSLTEIEDYADANEMDRARLDALKAVKS